MVCQLSQGVALYDLSRRAIDTIISNPINSKHGIKLSVDKPLNNNECLNIHRPAVLRQYFGKEMETTNDVIERYTYGSGSGTTSVGMDPNNYVTRSLSTEMICMIDDIHQLLIENRSLFNMNDVDLNTKFNHCTVLLYYTGKGMKKTTSLGYHTDCVYSPTTGEYVTKHNSQKENTPAVIYSIGDKRRLNWKSRYISDNIKGRKVWKESNDDRMSFELESDTMTIIHPRDENPLSEKNKLQRKQYLHGGVNLSGEKFSVGLVFRVVNKTCMYHLSDDTMVYHNSAGCGDVIRGILGIDIMSFHWNLLTLYRNTLY